MPEEYIKYQNEITSADDLNKQGRKSDVLIEALNKCEKLEKQLKIAMHCINEYCRSGCNPLAQKTKRQIEELNNENSN